MTKKSLWIYMFVQIVLLAGATTAHATRARLQALGQDKNGSLFIKDDRNVFLNPAYLVQVPNRINLEAGNQNRVNGTTTNDPKAEGGIVYQLPQLSLAAQLGRVSKAADNIDAQPSLSSVNFYDPQNSVEVIVAGKSAISWGGSLHYANSESDTGETADFPDSKARIISGRAGAATDRLQVYGVWDVIHESETKTSSSVTQKYDGKLSAELGAGYTIDDKSSIGGYIYETGNDFDDGAGVKGEYQKRVAKATYFYWFRADEEMKVFGSTGLYYESGKSDYDAAGTANEKQDYLSIPMALGFESRMTPWLKLRGSVAQNVLIDQDKYSNGAADLKTDSEDDTTVTLGSSVTFEKFTLDATLEGSGSAGNGKVNGDTLMANVGVTYDF